jgi:hypothetical protein
VTDAVLRLRAILAGVLLLAAATASAQPRAIFDPDDFVDPRGHEEPLFISRVVVGGVRNAIDDVRPAHQDEAFLHVTNSVYWGQLQFDYKRTEARGENDDPSVSVCLCQPPIYFPTPPPDDATPEPPVPGSKDTLQAAWYWPDDGMMLRSRLSWSGQPIETTLTSISTGQIVEHRSGHEQSFTLDTDTRLRIHGHAVWGSLLVARSKRSGTIDDREQTDVLYTNRFPGVALGRVIVRANLTVGVVTGRGASGINVVAPAVEAFWRERHTGVNFHVAWNPQSMRSGAAGWEMHHQIAVFVDRGYVWFSR